MPKLFCTSDIHGFADEMKKALNDAGFDPCNSEHFLVVLGDCFDRGSQPVEVMRYLQGLPRKVLVKGNHEELLRQLCDRGYPGAHDYSNGTYDTVCEFGNAGLGNSFDECCLVAYNRTKDFIDSMVNYFETKNYIFVHGWIPVACNDGLPIYYRNNRKFEFNPEWRTAHYSEWEQARWLNGIDMARKGFVEPGKTIVCGHWHCSYGHYIQALRDAIASGNSAFDEDISEFGDNAIWEPYYGDGIIAIDKCTAHTRKVNVLVLEDEFLE
jgi:serine/threonine protein phosphatase 1